MNGDQSHAAKQRNRHDLAGQRFGRWTVVARAPSGSGNRSRWFCQCDCGAIGNVDASNLKKGDSQSCGCLQAERTSAANTRHGATGTTEYTIWKAIIRRCENSKAPGYEDYGGRGIKV